MNPNPNPNPNVSKSFPVALSGRRTVGLVTALAAATLLASCAQSPVAPSASSASSAIAPPAAAATATGGVAAPSTASASGATPPSAQSPNLQPIQPGLPGAVPPRTLSSDAKSVATTAALTPDGAARYFCERTSANSVSRVAIELPEGTARICSRFPAMGPCQYERAACRASGGRVIRFDGIEITRDVESEYDRQVQRIRLNAG